VVVGSEIVVVVPSSAAIAGRGIRRAIARVRQRRTRQAPEVVLTPRFSDSSPWVARSDEKSIDREVRRSLKCMTLDRES
jgi:hypothetical protein